jgi:hypothetical protein
VGGLVMGIFVNINKLYDMPQLHDYKEGIMVVFMIGLSKYFELILGNIMLFFNTKYYKTVLFLGVLLVVIAVVLNAIFIPIYGIIGSAFATLLSITIYSLAKLLFVVKFALVSIYKTVTSLVVTLYYLLLLFWEFPFTPIISIGFKSILVTLYMFTSITNL